MKYHLTNLYTGGRTPYEIVNARTGARKAADCCKVYGVDIVCHSDLPPFVKIHLWFQANAQRITIYSQFVNSFFKKFRKIKKKVSLRPPNFIKYLLIYHSAKL